MCIYYTVKGELRLQISNNYKLRVYDFKQLKLNEHFAGTTLFSQLNQLSGKFEATFWLQLFFCHDLPVLCVFVFGVRGQQYVAQTTTIASVLHAPGRSERRRQLSLWALVQSPQLLQLLRYFHESLSIQQPHEPCRERAFSTGQFNNPYLTGSYAAK